MNLSKIIQILDRILITVQKVLLIICTAAMTLLIIWQVIARRVLMLSTPYAEELARLAIVWCIFIGAALAVRFDDHAKMDVILRKLSIVPQTILRVLISVLIIVFAFVVVKYGMEITANAWSDRTTSLQYPNGLFYLPAALSGILMLVYSLANIVKAFIGIKGKEKEGKEVSK